MIIIKFLKNKKGLKCHSKRFNPFKVCVILELFLIIWVVELASFFTVTKVYNKA